MFGTMRFGARAFFLGVAIGLLIAPRPGWETRRLVRRSVGRFLDGLTEFLALPEEPVVLRDREARVGVGAAQGG